MFLDEREVLFTIQFAVRPGVAESQIIPAVSPTHARRGQIPNALGRAPINQQLASVQKLASLNPTLSAFADPTNLNALVTAAAKAPIPTEELAKYDAALGFYETSLRPALLSSRIAPALLALGEHLPIVGQHIIFPAK